MIEYGLPLVFDDQSPCYAHGFEAGRVWQLLRLADDDQVVMVESVHQSNAEMWLRMGEATSRRVSWQERGDLWAGVTFEAVRP